MIRSNEPVYSQWISSIHSATKCIRNIKTKITSIDSGYIKYTFAEPSCEVNREESLHLGVRKDAYSDDIYRYTGIFFFDSDLNTMIKNAEEIEVTFDLVYDADYVYSIEDSSIAEDKYKDDKTFRNSVLLKGHSFRSFYDLREHWDNIAYTEFKTNYYCPFACSLYEELRDALANKAPSFSFKLNNSLLRDFERYRVKGLHLFCQSGMNGHWRIKNQCKVSITRFKAEYNHIISSDTAVVYKNTRELRSNKVSRTKLVEQDTILCGYGRQHAFYFFGDKFNDLLNQAKELQITVNITWFNPNNIDSDLNDIGINENSCNGPVKLVGHSFKTVEEIVASGTDKYVIFEMNEGEDINHSIIVDDFDKALREGRTSYTFTLKEEDIELFKDMQGFRIGKVNDSAAIGQWTMSEHCEVKITEYIDDDDVFKYPLENDITWIFENKPVLVGTKKEVSVVEHAGFYFFNDFKEKLVDNELKSLRIRLFHEYDVIPNTDSPYKKHYYVCGHNYLSVAEAQNDNYNFRDNIISIVKCIEGQNAEYTDLYITDKNLLDKVKQYDGLCVYSMRNTTLTTHSSSMMVYINYENGIVEPESRVFSYMPNANSDSVANTYMTNSTDIDDRFLCGNIEGNILKPFMFFKTDFHDFINSDINIQSIIIRLIAGEPVEKEVDGNVYKSLTYLDNVEIYTHDIKYDQLYCYCYQYNNKLCDTELMTGQYTNINQADLTLDKAHLINMLKESYGIGAYALNAQTSEFIYIQECQIVVNYTK